MKVHLSVHPVMAEYFLIYENPEPYYKEFQAHDNICSLLERLGYKAEFGSGGNLEDSGHHHACGHNLIATSPITAFLTLAGLICSGNIEGRVHLLGTPAEESGGDKIDLLNAGAYRGVDACLMGHPGPLGSGNDGISCPTSPWAGVNALDASVALPLIKRVHGIILHGGEHANIIPEIASMEFYARSDSSQSLQELCARLEGCFNGAALATGCTVDFEWDPMYIELKSNQPLGGALTTNMRAFGSKFVAFSKEGVIGGSTGQGNVMHEIHGIYCSFAIGLDGVEVWPHTPEFAAAAGTKQAFQRGLDCAKGLAATGFQVLTDLKFRDAVPQSHIYDR
ncbi:hypothetical protein BJX66DRAFT_326877 [Aspergillus keveii]|uniref:Amidohydrolase n=1 Tax=Aspergillus keveii TaxID=714993 RepID=A0ABR4FZQ5_9EURO